MFTRRCLLLGVPTGLTVGAVWMLNRRPDAQSAAGPVVPALTDPKAAMSDADFEALLERSMAELRALTAAHAGLGMDKYARWDFSQDTGELVLTDPVRGVARAPAQVIGTWLADDSTWLWAWDNPSIAARLTADARRVRQFGHDNALPRLTRAKIGCPESEAWRFAALAMHLCGAQGVYRGPAGPTGIFLSFGDVRLSKS